AYQGPLFPNALANILPQLKTGIVRRCGQAKGLAVLPKRRLADGSASSPCGQRRAVESLPQIGQGWAKPQPRRLHIPPLRRYPVHVQKTL
ncbi:MAG: hypothetical protein ACREDJ_09130, partial [Methylocella sp.]